MLIGMGWAQVQAGDVNITPTLRQVEVEHQGNPVVIERHQDNQHQVDPAYALTSRPCPPFCVQPATLAPGVETIAELEVLDYLEKMQWGDAVLVVDSRGRDWVERGTIPGSVNIPWSKLNLDQGANPLEAREILTDQFNARETDGFWDFSQAKTLVLFCNGPWCGQSPANLKTLLRLGYPAHKLKWYRGGMQAWHALGFTTVKP